MTLSPSKHVCISLLICSFLSTAFSKASTVQITSDGTITTGIDFTGVFVPANTYLTGQQFNLVYTFNDLAGQQSVESDIGGLYGTSISGVNADSPGLAVLTFNGRQFTFGDFPGKYPATTVSSFATGTVPTPTQMQSQLEENVVEYYSGVPNSAEESYVDATVATVTQDPPITTDPVWEDSLTHALTSDDQYASVASDFLIRDETGLSPLVFAYGSLKIDTITVAGLEPSSAAPEPGSLLFSLSGLIVFLWFAGQKIVRICLLAKSSAPVRRLLIVGATSLAAIQGMAQSKLQSFSYESHQYMIMANGFVIRDKSLNIGILGPDGKILPIVDTAEDKTAVAEANKGYAAYLAAGGPSMVSGSNTTGAASASAAGPAIPPTVSATGSVVTVTFHDGIYKDDAVKLEKGKATIAHADGTVVAEDALTSGKNKSEKAGTWLTRGAATAISLGRAGDIQGAMLGNIEVTHENGVKETVPSDLSALNSGGTQKMVSSAQYRFGPTAVEISAARQAALDQGCRLDSGFLDRIDKYGEAFKKLSKK